MAEGWTLHPLGHKCLSLGVGHHVLKGLLLGVEALHEHVQTLIEHHLLVPGLHEVLVLDGAVLHLLLRRELHALEDAEVLLGKARLRLGRMDLLRALSLGPAGYRLGPFLMQTWRWPSASQTSVGDLELSCFK